MSEIHDLSSWLHKTFLILTYKGIDYRVFPYPWSSLPRTRFHNFQVRLVYQLGKITPKRPNSRKR
jgi:hypothetical protein